MPPVPDLKPLVGRLATMRAKDARAVLGQLSPEHRATLEDMVRRFGVDADVHGAAPEAEPTIRYDIAQVSPWLFDLIEGAGAEITQAARGLLRSIAEETFPCGSGKPRPRARQSRLLSRLYGRHA